MLPCAPGTTVLRIIQDNKTEINIVIYLNCKLFANINQMLDCN